MTRDDLYPIIDRVLHARHYQYDNAGSFWIERIDGDVQLCIHELAEALCDAIVARQEARPAVGDDIDIVERLLRIDDWLAAWQEARRAR